MKIENKIKYNCVKDALTRWVLGTDGQYDATCDLLNVIPWDDELKSIISWNDVCDEIIKSFGNRTDENGDSWDVIKILTNPDELERFHNFIIAKTDKVMIVYQGIIDKANKLYNSIFKISVYKFVGVKNNEAKYESVYHYFGNNLTTLAKKVYNKIKVSGYKNDDFIDAVHFALCNNSPVVCHSELLNERVTIDIIKSYRE